MDPKYEDVHMEFSAGAGLLNPTKAVFPGLVYDASEKDCVEFLCKQGYNTTALGLISGDKSVCRTAKRGRGWDLNYPSLTLAVEDGQKMINASFFRTVTNVGLPKSTYHVRINNTLARSFLSIKVEPSVLSFDAVGEKKSFVVKVNGSNITNLAVISASIIWEDGVHVVRSPLVIYNVLPQTLTNNTENKKSSVRD
ncbi:hypothetical protein L484_005369 [Morus notabilis]|uniref:Subtilisin-like protease fibronectin type-III domain-containing protein n=1 Tax=Morus notabilis TaxID=981085 RepID=W9SJM7_9ROSA|nr:hypothetical protein L484_005369 [Morus notabilis]